MWSLLFLYNIMPFESIKSINSVLSTLFSYQGCAHKRLCRWNLVFIFLLLLQFAICILIFFDFVLSWSSWSETMIKFHWLMLINDVELLLEHVAEIYQVHWVATVFLAFLFVFHWLIFKITVLLLNLLLFLLNFYFTFRIWFPWFLRTRSFHLCFYLSNFGFWSFSFVPNLSKFELCDFQT